MIKKTMCQLFALLVLFATSCSKNSEETKITQSVEEEEKQNPTSDQETFNYASSGTYNLNIVYFVPKDSKARIDSHRRLSEILLNGQEFYRNEMIRNGFGDKTFHLLVDDEKNRVKIDFIEGHSSAATYPYEGGGVKMIEEIEAYYDKNPSKRNSDHYLVLSPVENPQEADAPYYGLGKWCFATDYDDMDIKYLGGNSTLSNLATTYIGGLLHELGHGLNLPHNKEMMSQTNSSDFGTALMGSGNYTYGSTPTFLTAASCAILENNQVFSPNNNDYYTGANGKVDEITATFDNGNINLTGTLNTDIPVNSISIYNDPSDDEADYDAVSWVAKVENDQFEIAMPVAELYKKQNIDYVLRLLLNHTNGDISRLSYQYEFKNGVPLFGFGKRDYIDRTDWSIASFSSQEDSGGEGDTGRASDILDGNLETYWHSCWQGSCTNNEYPHSLIVDAGASTTIDGFTFVQRQNLSRSVKNIEIRVSNDNETWQSLGNFNLANINTAQHIQLDNSISFRYFELVSKSAHDGQQFASLAEVLCF